jgi:ATP-dependent DNA ligase
LFFAISGGYARIVNIAKAKVGFIEPMLALAVTKLPQGPARSYELKFDGCRALGVMRSRGALVVVPR